MSYENYKHLIGLPFIEGSQDCYGLARRYYKAIWGVEIINAARPSHFWSDPETNILHDLMGVDEWEMRGLNTRLLKPGDGLIISINMKTADHVAVYTGNGMILHHLRNRFSCEESLLPRWSPKVLQVVRHKQVTEAREMFVNETELETILPGHVKNRIIISPRQG